MHFRINICLNDFTIVEVNFDSWIKPRKLILGFGNPNKEVWMIELNFSMWFLRQYFYWNKLFNKR